MDHPCTFCERSFSSGRELGSHVRSCIQNPKYAEIKAKRIASQTQERVSYFITCLKCPNAFTLVITKKQFEAGAYRKHCSRSCANGHQHSSDTIIRIQNSLHARPKLPEYVENICVICHQTFQRKRRTNTKTCTNPVCRSQFRSERLRGNASGKRGGYRPRSVQVYNNTGFDSMWEVALAKRLDELHVHWERNAARYLSYVDLNGRVRKYFPDFYVPSLDTYIEVKGYATTATKHKMSDAATRNNVKLVILTSLEAIGSFKV